MAKHLDEQTILNELHGGSAFFRPSPTPAEEKAPQRISVKKHVERRGANQRSVQHQKKADEKNPNQPANQSTDPSTNRLADQPAVEPATHPADQSLNSIDDQAVVPLANGLASDGFDMSPVLPKPKAFYITEKQDEDLDILVKKLSERVKGRTAQKIDRSVTTRLIFESSDLTSDDTAERLAKQLTSRLASQLTSQLDDL